MFLGHFGVGFGAKAVSPRRHLSVHFFSPRSSSIFCGLPLLLVGLEKVEIAPGITRVTPLDFTDYPITHSLIAVMIWASLFAAAYYLLRR